MKLISLNMDPETRPAILHRPAGGEKKKNVVKLRHRGGSCFSAKNLESKNKKGLFKGPLSNVKAPLLTRQ